MTESQQICPYCGGSGKARNLRSICPLCGHDLRLQDNLRLQDTRCPSCGASSFRQVSQCPVCGGSGKAR